MVMDAEFTKADFTPFVYEVGRLMPSWFVSALSNGEIRIHPTPKKGQLNWGGRQIEVVKTGQRFEKGETLYKGDLFSRSP